jgi:hypothetical protein
LNSGFKSNFSIKPLQNPGVGEVLRAALFQLVIVGAGGVGEVLYSPRLAHLRFSRGFYGRDTMD